MTKRSIAFRVGRGVIVIAAVLVILFVWSENHQLKEINEGMRKLLSQYQNSMSLQLDQERAIKSKFSEADCRRIYADLDSKNPAKLNQWKRYFRHAVEADAKATLEERL